MEPKYVISPYCIATAHFLTLSNNVENVFMTLVILSVCLSVRPRYNLRKNYYRRMKFLSLVQKVFSTYGIENGEFWLIRFDLNPGQKNEMHRSLWSDI